MKTDMYSLLHGAATDGLSDVQLELHAGTAVTVVLAPKGILRLPSKAGPRWT